MSSVRRLLAASEPPRFVCFTSLLAKSSYGVGVTKILLTATWLAASFLCAFGQQLPLKHYNVEDGLGHSIVGAIYQDRKGYLWARRLQLAVTSVFNRAESASHLAVLRRLA